MKPTRIEFALDDIDIEGIKDKINESACIEDENDGTSIYDAPFEIEYEIGEYSIFADGKARYTGCVYDGETSMGITERLGDFELIGVNLHHIDIVGGDDEAIVSLTDTLYGIENRINMLIYENERKAA